MITENICTFSHFFSVLDFSELDEDENDYCQFEPSVIQALYSLPLSFTVHYI